MTIRKVIATLAGLAGLAAAVAPAQAQYTLLAPGGTVTPVTSVAASGLGTLLATSGAETMFPSRTGGLSTVTATLDSSVYKETNGDFVFAYTLANAGASTSSLDSLILGNFTGLTTLVAYETGSPVAPASATRDASSSTITFNFPSPKLIGPGKSSTLLIETNAAGFDKNGTAIANNGGSHFLLPPNFAYEPLISNGNPVVGPEPASLTVFALLGLGLLGLALRARRSGAARMAA
jgi:hypothetical protein